MILREGTVVRGLTTAASVWAVSSIGVVVGAGEYVIGVSLTALILLILEMHYLPLLSRLGANSTRARAEQAILLEEEAPLQQSREDRA